MHAHAFALLRAIHILAGGLWVGAAVLNAAYVIPSVMAAGPAGGQVMRVMAQVRRLPVFMNWVMAVTLATGLWLYTLDSGGFRLEWITSSAGLTFTAGALLGIATAAIGWTVTVPTVGAIGRLGQAIAAGGGPPSPEQAAEMAVLQRRVLKAAQVGSTMVVLATLAMAMARFL